jgi:transcriptional regulator with XRE-family HTH domain
MIQTNELRGIIAKRGLSQRKVAAALGMTDKTFYAKMKKGVFSSDELYAMIQLLEIEDPVPIFFAHEGAR